MRKPFLISLLSIGLLLLGTSAAGAAERQRDWKIEVDNIEAMVELTGTLFVKAIDPKGQSQEWTKPIAAAPGENIKDDFDYATSEDAFSWSIRLTGPLDGDVLLTLEGDAHIRGRAKYSRITFADDERIKLPTGQTPVLTLRLLNVKEASATFIATQQKPASDTYSVVFGLDFDGNGLFDNWETQAEPVTAIDSVVKVNLGPLETTLEVAPFFIQVRAGDGSEAISQTGVWDFPKKIGLTTEAEFKGEIFSSIDLKVRHRKAEKIIKLPSPIIPRGVTSWKDPSEDWARVLIEIVGTGSSPLPGEDVQPSYIPTFTPLQKNGGQGAVPPWLWVILGLLAVAATAFAVWRSVARRIRRS